MTKVVLHKHFYVNSCI